MTPGSPSTGLRDLRTVRSTNPPGELLEAFYIAVPGRGRLRISGLRRADAQHREHIEHRLRAVPGVRLAHANSLTGNVLVLYDHRLSKDEFIGRVRQSLASEASDRAAGSDTDGVPLWHALTVATAAARLDTSPRRGLSDIDAARRLARYGPNALPVLQRRSAWSILMGQLLTLPVGLLTVSAGVSAATGGLADALVILGVVGINAAIGYFTESQAERTIESLGKGTPRTARVLRDGEAASVPAEAVVPGDVVLLAPGAHVPADSRLMETHLLSLDESALTGESMPVQKSALHIDPADTPLADRHGMVYMGTVVTGGNAMAAVTATGARTELGRIQTLMGDTAAPETPMQRQLHAMGTQLALLSGAVCGGVFAAGLLRGYGFAEMLKASISLAVAAVPEGLPAVATTTLAMGIRQLGRQRVAVRRLDAVETLGTVRIFCLDKTGTLTLNRMAVRALHADGLRVWHDAGRFTVDGVDGQEVPPSSGLLRLLELVSLCSDATPAIEQNPAEGSATEIALVEAAAACIDVPELRRRYPRLKVEYRAEDRPYMTSLHRNRDRSLMVVKGSPRDVLAMSNRFVLNGRLLPLDDDRRGAILAENDALASDGLRILGAAYVPLQDGQDAHSDDLIWVGLAGLADPIRDGMAPLMSRFHQAGIHTVMITGDQSATAYAIGKRLNLSNGEPMEIFDSVELENLDPELLRGLVSRVHVFARVSPAQKLKIIQALQQAGNVVAMTGDGINDGPALKAADIGVAMGRNGTDVARSVADVVLHDDNLDTMIVAVRQGRTIYANIRKALHFLLATNFTEIEVMLAGVCLGQGQSLSPTQLLWINLITDIFPGLALSMEPPEPDILEQPPRNPREPIIRRDDLRRMGFESAVISGGALASYGYALLRYGPGPRATTQAFTTLTFGQLLHAVSCRSDEHGLFNAGRRPSNPYLTAALGGSLALQVMAATMPALRRLLGTTPLGAADALVSACGAILPLLVNEASKLGRPRRHG